MLNDGGTVTISGIDTFTVDTGSNVDVVVLSGAEVAGKYYFDGGSDSLTTSNLGATLTVDAVETITGGTGVEIIYFEDGVTGAEINLGAGIDEVTLVGSTAGTFTVENVESVFGNAGDDVSR